MAKARPSPAGLAFLVDHSARSAYSHSVIAKNGPKASAGKESYGFSIVGFSTAAKLEGERVSMTTKPVMQTNVSMIESDAIHLARQGDAGAFEYLYTSYRKRVYSLCLRMVKNSADAEDLTQQAFLQVFRKIGTFRGESGFSTWLHRVTINVVLMHLRRKKPTEPLAQDAESLTTDGVLPRELGVNDVSLVGAIDRLNLRRALHQLPWGYRRFFLLHDVVGYKHSEIARILRCSVGCSKSQLHKARKRLRNLLQGESWQGQPGAVAV